MKSTTFNDPQLSLVTEFWGNNYAHVILTEEADSSPTDARELLNDNCFVGCHSSKSNDLSVHARIDSSGYIRLLWKSGVDDRNGHAAIFEIIFGKTSKRAVKEPRERSAALKPVASVVESSNLGPTEDPFSLQQVAPMTPRTGNW